MSVKKLDLWIGGEFRSAKDNAVFIDHNPLDDSPYAEAAKASADDVHLAVEAAHAAFASYRSTTPGQRETWLSKAADLLEQRKDAFADVLIDEIGSPLLKAHFEIKYAIAHLRTAAGIPRRITGQTLPSDVPGRFSMSVREPLGVFACITPFNVPLIKAMKQCTGPLATGNTVVMLASEEAPALAILVAELFRDAGFPAGTFNVITGFGHEIGDSLVTHPRVRGVNFTGSTRVGRHLSMLCGEHMKRALLELGGKNPLIILKDADLDAAVHAAVFGMFLFQGQACMASSRILVEAPIYDEFLKRYKAAAAGVGYGDLRDPKTMLGPIISQRQRDRIRHHIENAVANGATLETGGKWEGNRCLPTILTNVNPSMVCYQEETFGPVTAIYKVGSADAALAIANDTAYGLSAAVFTQNLAEAMRLSQQIHAGMVHINAPTLHDEPHVPFGGVGDSGMGREGAQTDIDHCTEWKWITIQAPEPAMAIEKTISLSAEAKAVAARVGSLRDFLAYLGEHDQCVYWPDPVLPEPDIRNISVAAGNNVSTGPAVIFDKIRGYPGKRIAVNVHGSFGNLALLLGLPKTTPVRELFLKSFAGGVQISLCSNVFPGKAPVNENRINKNINLYDLLPLYRINANDGGFYIAKACVVSRDPLEPDNFGKQNVGIYRIQVMGPDTFTLLSIPAHDMGRQMLMAEQHGKPLKVSVMIGNHPAMPMFAATPVGYDESEFAYASQMMGAPLRLTTAVNGTDILADTEMVIEGELQLNQREVEGPFGEFPGSYSGVRKVPLFRVTGVSHRNNPIFENIYIGKGWTEHDTLIGLNTSAPIYAQLKKDFPEVAAVNALYQHGLTGIISVKNRFSGFAKSVAMRALGTPHGTMYLKNLILVDENVDPFDLNQVMWALSTRTRANDIIVIPNMPMVPIDPAAEVPGKGHRLIIDATSFMVPDNLGADPHLVDRPMGPEIDALMQRLNELQKGGAK